MKQCGNCGYSAWRMQFAALHSSCYNPLSISKGQSFYVYHLAGAGKYHHFFM
jgi:hypothetical protein